MEQGHDHQSVSPRAMAQRHRLQRDNESEMIKGFEVVHSKETINLTEQQGAAPQGWARPKVRCLAMPAPDLNKQCLAMLAL